MMEREKKREREREAPKRSQINGRPIYVRERERQRPQREVSVPRTASVQDTPASSVTAQ